MTDTSSESFVFVLLTSSLGTNTESALLTEHWRALANRFGDVKFCQMRADLCIEGYPERNTPTILVYKDGDIKRQIVTLKELSGVNTSIADLEKILFEVGAVQPNDSRLSRHRKDETNIQQSGGLKKGGKTATLQDEEDSDWE